MKINEFLKKVFRFHPSNPSYWAKKFFGGELSLAGVEVDEEKALTYSAVYGCVRIIAETIASLPLNIYKRLPDGGKQKDTEHSLYWLLHNQPNENMTSFIWRELAKAHILLWGNHYSFLDRDGTGRVHAIYPMLPWRVKPEIIKDDQGRKVKVYDYIDDEGQIKRLSSYYVLHILGLSFDGLVGKSPLSWYREQIGIGLAQQEYSSRFFSSGMHAGGVFTTPQALKEETYQRLKKELKEKYAGLSKAHESMILEQELKFDKISINPNDAQLLESKHFQVEEIARIFRVPLHLLQELLRSTYSNIEHQGIDFVVHTIRPWLVRDEQAYNMQLLREGEKRTHFIEYVVDGLLRGDTESRYKSYNIARMGGWMSGDEIRELENMNPMPEGQGKIYYMPLNMMPLSQLTGEQKALEKKNIELVIPKAIESVEYRSDKIRYRLTQSYKPLISNIATRIIKRETQDILKEAKKIFKQLSKDVFYQFLEEYYEKHKDFIKLHSKPVFVDMGKAIAAEAAAEVSYEIGTNDNLDKFLDSYAETYTLRHARENKDRIIKVVERGYEKGYEPVEMLEVEFKDWEETKPDEIADKQSVKLSGATSKVIYGAAGVTKLIWHNTSGHPCPYCQAMNGKVVGISEPFFLKGSEFMPEGAESSLIFGTDITHPPLHKKCSCMIGAGI